MLGVVSGIPVNIVGYLNDMASWYKDGQTVPLDFAGNLREDGAMGVASAQITQQDLQAEANRLSNQVNRLLTLI